MSTLPSDEQIPFPCALCAFAPLRFPFFPPFAVFPPHYQPPARVLYNHARNTPFGNIRAEGYLDRRAGRRERPRPYTSHRRAVLLQVAGGFRRVRRQNRATRIRGRRAAVWAFRRGRPASRQKPAVPISEYQQALRHARFQDGGRAHAAFADGGERGHRRRELPTSLAARRGAGIRGFGASQPVARHGIHIQLRADGALSGLRGDGHRGVRAERDTVHLRRQ